MIYSHNVPTFRIDDSGLLDESYPVTYLTSAAPRVPYVKKTEPHRLNEIDTLLKERIRRILQVAVKYKHRVLVLGAFGCGCFANDPKSVASWFHEFLTTTYRDVFECVVFAVYVPQGGRTTNYDVFQNQFSELVTPVLVSDAQ